MPRGYQACGEGTGAWENEVESTITLASPPMELTVWGTNPAIGFPGAKLFINGRECVKVVGQEGTKAVWDDGVLRYTVQRLADGQWKEFTVTLSDSEQPSASGLPARCPGINQE